MKQLLSVVLTFLASLSFAQVVNNLVVFCNDGEPFTLIMNGERYNEKPQTKLRVTGLTLPQYKVTIIFENKKKKTHNTTLTFYNTGWECEFSLNRRGNHKYSMDFFTQKRIEGFDSINENKDNQENNSEPKRNPVQTSPPPTQTLSTGSNTLAPATNTALTGTGPTPTNDPNVLAVPKKCDSPLSNEEFEKYKKEILKKTTDEERKILSNVLLESHCLLTGQVKQIIDVFVGDKFKIDFAKKAYPMTKDFINYSKLTETFITAPVKDEFKKFLSNKK